jgi:hypothetical protein
MSYFRDVFGSCDLFLSVAARQELEAKSFGEGFPF